MASAGTVKAYLDLDAQKFRDELERSKEGMRVFTTIAKKMAEPIGKGLIAGGASMLAFAGYTGLAARDMTRLEKSLAATFRDPREIAAYAAQIAELGSTPPFTIEQFEKLAKQLRTFEKDVASNLVRVGDAAAATGAPFDTLAEAVAAFGIKAESTNQILEKLNISPQDLAKAGAVLDKTGKALDLSRENLGKNQAALEKLMDRFAGGMDRVVTNVDRVKGGLDLLTKEVGKGVSEFADFAAGALLPVIQYLRDLSPETKKTIGVMVGVAGAAAVAAGAFLTVGAAISGIVSAVVTSALGVTLGTLALTVVPALVSAFGGLVGVLGAAATGVASAAAAFPILLVPATKVISLLGTLSGQVVALEALSLKGLAASAAAAFAPFALAVTTVGALAYGFNKVTNDLKYQNEQEKRLFEIEENRVVKVRELRDYVGKTSEELKAQGKTAADATNAVLILLDAIERAGAAGNDALEEKLKAQLKELKTARAQLASEEKAARDKATKEAGGNSTKAKDARLKDLRDVLEAELDGIELRLAKESISEKQSFALRQKALEEYSSAVAKIANSASASESDLRKKAVSEYEQAEQRKRDLAIETAKAETEARKKSAADDKTKAEKARKTNFEDELSRIEVLRIENKISAEKEVELLKNVLKTYKLNEEEKRSLKKQTAQAEAKIRDESAKAEKKSVEDKRKDRLDDALADVQKRRDANQITAQEEIDAIDKIAQTFKLTEDEKRSLMLKTSGLRKTLNDQAKKDAQDLADAEAKANDLKTQSIDRQIDTLQKKTEETGQDNTAKIRSALEEQLRLEIEQIQLEAQKAQAATKSADARAQIEKNAQSEIQEAILKTAEREEEAVQRQLDARKRLEKKKSDFTFGSVFDISELGDRLNQERSTTTRRPTSPAAGFSNLQNLSAEINRSQSLNVARPDTAQYLRELDPVKVEGEIKVEVTVDDRGARVSKVATSGPSLDGRLSGITRDARGMKGSIGIA